MKLLPASLGVTALLFAMLAMSFVTNAKAENDRVKLALIYESPSSFEETLDSLREAVRSHNFRVFPDRYLEQGLTDEFSVNTSQVSVRFCNFNELYEALQIEPQIGVVMPCTITVIEREDGTVQLVTANVNAMMALFGNKRLTDAFKGIEVKYEAILDEVTL